MLDLVGNPEYWFSRVEAPSIATCILFIATVPVFADDVYSSTTWVIVYEPRREKTGLRGFRPGPTQTGLYKLRKQLEA